MRHGSGRKPDELLAWFARLLLGREVSALARDQMIESVKSHPVPEQACRLAAMVLCSPEAQLN